MRLYLVVVERITGDGILDERINRDEILDFPRIIEIPSSGAVQHIRAGGIRLSSYRLWQGTRRRPQQQRQPQFRIYVDEAWTDIPLLNS